MCEESTKDLEISIGNLWRYVDVLRQQQVPDRQLIVRIEEDIASLKICRDVNVVAVFQR